MPEERRGEKEEWRADKKETDEGADKREKRERKIRGEERRL